MESNVKHKAINKHNLKDYVRIYVCILCCLIKKSYMTYLKYKRQ